MNQDELREFLLNRNSEEPPVWEDIKNMYCPVPVDLINGENVYLFNFIFNEKQIPVEDSIYISQRPPKAYIPLHVHQYIELIYVYQGECRVILRENEIQMSIGDVIIIDKNTPHTVRETSCSDIIIEIKLKHDYLSSNLINRLTKKSIIAKFLIDSLINIRSANNYLYFSFNENSKVILIMDQILCEYFEKDVFTSEIINSYLFILFTDLVRYNNSIIAHLNNKKDNEITVIDFLKYIENNYKDCSLTKMSANFKYHPNYISAVLKKATGKSFIELLHTQRINKAALYLLNSDMAISEIAEEVGYSSLSFFYKKFYEVFRQTPKEYRENKR
jgi:AraC-like DNA-binding protein